jgi:hypothetical protein
MKIRILRLKGAPQVETERLTRYLAKLGIEAEYDVTESQDMGIVKRGLYPKFPDSWAMDVVPFIDRGKGVDLLIVLWNASPYDEAVAIPGWNGDGRDMMIVSLPNHWTDDFYRIASHEIIHCLISRLRYKYNITVTDDMDLYDKEMEPDALDGNRARHIARLQPYRSLLDPAAGRKKILQQIIDLLTAFLAPKSLKVPTGLAEIIATFGNAGDEKNIESFELPYPLKYTQTVGDKAAVVQVTKSRCHTLMIPIFKAVLTELKQKGLDKYVQNYGGIYEYRQQRTGDVMSTHAWGIAIDCEPQKYPLGSKDRLPREVVAIFKAHGFVCGEDFPISDPGHFQYAKGY